MLTVTIILAVIAFLLAAASLAGYKASLGVAVLLLSLIELLQVLPR